jgi:hypothetical protein
VRTWAGRWWRVVLEYDTEPIQLSLAALLLCWGVLIALPLDSWHRAVTYVWLDAYTDENVWIVLTLTVSVTWFYGFFRRLYPLRQWCALASMAFWIILAVSSLISSPVTFGWIAYGVFASQSGWVFLRGGG